MKIVYAHNWFLDYRIPVFEELKKVTDDNFYVLYNKNNVPLRIHEKLKIILGDKAIAFIDEKKIVIGNEKKSGDFANKVIKISYQPGLYRQIKNLKPDVLIGEGFFRWGLTNLIYRAFNNTKYVMLYERTKHTERNAKKIITYIRKLVMRYIDGINCNGIQCKEYITSLGYDEERITEKHMVADTQSITTSIENLTKEDQEIFKDDLVLKGKILLYCGQMVQRKGVKEILAGWELFKKKTNEPTTLLLIGDGPDLEVFKNIASHLDDVKFLKKVDFDIIYKYFAIADVFVILTLEDNGSIVMPEAMSAGLPIITSIYNGNYPEYITKDNGWVVNPNNAKEVSDIFIEAITKCDLVKMGKKSKDIVEGFTPKIAAEHIYTSCKKAYYDN
jgi:glycosyltransferase involved in cell wall biosynthesis